MTTTALTSKGNKTTKVKKLRGYGFCVFYFSFVWVLFCGGSSFLCFLQAYKFFYHQEFSHYIQIKHNRKKLLQRKKLRHNLGFS
jgi:hypothetical protein